MRAAILPLPGDPFLFNYWMSLFGKYWQGEVDRLYVMLNSEIEDDAVTFIENICKSYPHVVLNVIHNQTDHGIEILRGLEMINEEYVVLMEDDGFVFKQNVVSNLFKMIEGGYYDIVGSERGSCAMEIYESARNKWDLDYSGLGDHGPNFWPCFFFSKRETLLATDRNFCAKAWNQGETVAGLNYTVKVPQVVGDTFVNTSLQLRGMIPKNRILTIPQYHGSPFDLQHFENRIFLFDGRASWVHVGSLSSGISGVLQDGQSRPLSRRTRIPPGNATTLNHTYCNSEGEVFEWERRVAFFSKFVIYAEESGADKLLPDLFSEYKQAVERLIQSYGLNRKRIIRLIEAYKGLGL